MNCRHQQEQRRIAADQRFAMMQARTERRPAAKVWAARRLDWRELQPVRPRPPYSVVWQALLWALPGMDVRLPARPQVGRSQRAEAIVPWGSLR
jgi:hypothetical protein